MTTNACLEYKEFLGSVAVDIDSNILYGKIEFIEDLVTYEAETIEGIKEEFKRAVDDYLSTCAQVGKEPNRSFKGSFNVRISPELHRAASVAAKQRGIALNELVGMGIERICSENTPSVLHRHEYEIEVTHTHSINDFPALPLLNEWKTRKTGQADQLSGELIWNVQHQRR